MLIETLSVFPGVFGSYLGASIMGRAQDKGILEFRAHDLRDWTHDRHRTVDDAPFGGGQGMLMKPAPIFEAMADIKRLIPGPRGSSSSRRSARRSRKTSPRGSRTRSVSCSSAVAMRAWTSASTSSPMSR